MPNHWAFYFQGSGLLLSFSRTWSDSIYKAHIALQELQAVALRLYKMAFDLSDKVTDLTSVHPLHLDNMTVNLFM